MMKEFVVRFGDLPTDQAWHVQNLINNLLIQTTTDGEEGRRAFNEKRPPNFTGTLRRRGEAWPEPSEEDAKRLDERLSQRRVLDSAQIFVEPIERALPGFLGGGFVVARASCRCGSRDWRPCRCGPRAAPWLRVSAASKAGHPSVMRVSSSPYCALIGALILAASAALGCAP